MAREYRAGTFHGGPHFRWVKFYRGEWFRIRCKDLGLPEELWTKEGSRQASNEWWDAKKTEIDEPLLAKVKYLNERKSDLVQKAIDTDKELIQALTVEISELQGVPAPIKAASCKELADMYNCTKREEVKKGIRSADGADNERIALSHFLSYVGSATITEINFDVWHGWFVHCQAKIKQRIEDVKTGWSSDYGIKVFRVARAFVDWCCERGALDNPPRNLHSRKQRFERGTSDIETFTNDEIKCLLKSATGQLKLHLLLMLNTGMTQKDISDLRHSDVDYSLGTITRRRSKTIKKLKTPIVGYKLWKTTVKLLRQYRSRDEVYALLTVSGKRWVRKELEGERLRKSDNIATNFQHLRRKTSIRKSLKIFRKTSATRLKSSPFRGLESYFLGHSARSISDIHYAAESQAMMDKACDWLHDELFPKG